jgi:hypothetical protein
MTRLKSFAMKPLLGAHWCCQVLAQSWLARVATSEKRHTTRSIFGGSSLTLSGKVLHTGIRSLFLISPMMRLSEFFAHADTPDAKKLLPTTFDRLLAQDAQAGV